MTSRAAQIEAIRAAQVEHHYIHPGGITPGPASCSCGAVKASWVLSPSVDEQRAIHEHVDNMVLDAVRPLIEAEVREKVRLEQEELQRLRIKGELLLLKLNREKAAIARGTISA